MNEKSLSIVINFTKCSEGSTIASNRIAVEIASLGFLLVDDEKKSAELLKSKTDIDTLFVVNGLWAFCKFREDVNAMVSKAKKVVWCGNDWAIQKIKAVKERVDHINFCNHENFNAYKRFHYVPWNCLTYDHKAANQKPRPPTKKGLIYYGAFRDDRVNSFAKWIGGNPSYGVTVHTASKKSAEMFSSFIKKENVLTEKCFKPMSDSSSWEIGLYIEDNRSHKVYHSPANRFYEMITSRVPIAFCSTTKRTMEMAGFDVSPWLVENQGDVIKLIENRVAVLEAQRLLFCSVDHKENLMKTLKEIIKGI